MVEIEKAVIDLDSISEAYRCFLELHDNVFGAESLDVLYALMFAGKEAWTKYLALCRDTCDDSLYRRTPEVFTCPSLSLFPVTKSNNPLPA